MPPFRFLVDGSVSDRAQLAQDTAPCANHLGGKRGAGRRVHEGHELIRESRHGAADADTTNVRATADAGHPASLGHVTVNHRSPAAYLNQTLRRAVFMREVTLFIVT